MRNRIDVKAMARELCAGRFRSNLPHDAAIEQALRDVVERCAAEAVSQKSNTHKLDLWGGRGSAWAGACQASAEAIRALIRESSDD